MTITVRVTENTIDIEETIRNVQNSAHGAIDLFIGTVRNYHNGQKVCGITYDAHVGLTEKVFFSICSEAKTVWTDTSYAVFHYKGDLPVGGISIVVAVSSPHRAESFEACRYVIEEIKKRAPIWKQEHYLAGNSEWLPGHSLKDETPINQIAHGKNYV